MRVLNTLNLPTNVPNLWIYNGYDCAITSEISPVLDSRLDPETTQRTYNFERAMLGPAITMMRRGIKIDIARKEHLLSQYTALHFALSGMLPDAKGKPQVANAQAPLQQIALALWGQTINYNSDKQLKDLLYERLQ